MLQVTWALWLPVYALLTHKDPVLKRYVRPLTANKRPRCRVRRVLLLCKGAIYIFYSPSRPSRAYILTKNCENLKSVSWNFMWNAQSLNGIQTVYQLLNQNNLAQIKDHKDKVTEITFIERWKDWQPLSLKHEPEMSRETQESML